MIGTDYHGPFGKTFTYPVISRNGILVLDTDKDTKAK